MQTHEERMAGDWIWLPEDTVPVNERACFTSSFEVPGKILAESTPQFPTVLLISAVTKYSVYLNGNQIGNGPGRNERGCCFYDTYDVTIHLRAGENHLAVKAWNYGSSTYQSYAAPGALIFTIRHGKDVLCQSGPDTKAAADLGFISHAPKRNVNLGFAEYYDARCFSDAWIQDASFSDSWSCAACVGNSYQSLYAKPRIYDVDPAREVIPLPASLTGKQERRLMRNPLRNLDLKDVYPEKVLRLEEVRDGCRVVSVNTRQAFFGDRRDADETNFNAFMCFIIQSPRSQSGMISFPNRTWNGLIGTFRINETIYKVTDADREKAVSLEEGDNYCILFFHGKFDDLYCHIEFRFPSDIEVRKDTGEKACGSAGASGFLCIGPTEEIAAWQDGRHEIHPDIDICTDADRDILSCCSLEEVLQTAEMLALPVHCAAPEDVMENAYILSLERLAQPIAEIAAEEDLQGLLWNNDSMTRIDPPVSGRRRLIVDFGDICVGYPSFTIFAKEGTVIDLYGFENVYRDEIDYTIGLNNGARYICRDGWQSYTFMAKMGMRYAAVSIRDCGGEPVYIREFKLKQEVFSCGKQGSFECSDAALNHIWKMCRQTLKVSKLDTFADSPTYEQAFWLGDSQVSAIVDSYMSGDYDFIRHNLIVGASSTELTPIGNALTPTEWITPIPMWTMNWIVMLIQYMEYTGDTGIAAELYKAVRSRLLYYKTLITEKGGFLAASWNLVDWAKMDISNHCVSTAYQGLLAWCFEKGAWLSDLMQEGTAGSTDEKNVGRYYREDAEEFRHTAVILRSYLHDVLWDDGRKAYRDGWSPEGGLSKTFSVQTHAMLLLYDGIGDDERKAFAEGYLLDCPEDFVQAGSPFMLYYLYEALAALGRKKEIFDDIRFRWGEMVRYETTTCWEVFPGFYENSRTRSYCHAWSTAPALLMQKYLLGITSEAEGWRKISFSLPQTELSWCRGAIPTPHGPIYVDWDKTIRKILIKVPAMIEISEPEIPEEFEIKIIRLEKQ